MNAFVIIGQRHGLEKFEIVGGILSEAQARETFMPFRVKKTDPDFQNVRLCSLNEDRVERFSKEGSPDAAKAFQNTIKKGKL